MVAVESVLAVILVSISTVYRLPQIALTYTTGDVTGLSAQTLWINVAYSLLYIWYGVEIAKMAIIAIGIVTTAQASTMVSLYYYFRTPEIS